MRCILTILFLVAVTSQIVFADDFGPRGDVHEVRFVAQRLLAQLARPADPKNTKIKDVVVVKDSALLSWDAGSGHGFMGLIREHGRWWDALDKTLMLRPPATCRWETAVNYPLASNDRDNQDTTPPASLNLIGYGMTADVVDAASMHNEDVNTANTIARHNDSKHFHIDCIISREHAWPEITLSGGFAVESRQKLSGYSIFIKFPKNNAAGRVVPTLYARPPTPAEFLPYPTPFWFQSTAVLYFDLTIDGSAPVTFQAGTTIDIWFPFVLDDTLKYDLTIGFAAEPIGPIYAKPFDNVLRYTLPGFTAMPGKSLMGEIDGNRP